MRGVRQGGKSAVAELGGKSLTWLCGGALAINLIMVVGLMSLLAVHGLAYFWQRDLALVVLDDGTRLLGEMREREAMPEDPQSKGEEPAYRFRMKVANRDFTGADFVWIEESRVEEISYPPEATLLVRQEWGNFQGSLAGLKRGDEVLAEGNEPTWKALKALEPVKARARDEIEAVEKGDIGEINHRIEQLRLQRRRLELEHLPASELQARTAVLDSSEAELHGRYDKLVAGLNEKRDKFLAETLVLETADGKTKEIPVGDVLSAIRPNAMGLGSKSLLYLERIWEFVSGQPRESNTEGGIFPAIFGTVMMVFLMSVVAVPLGVLAAIYLREYAKQGFLVRTVRIAVNNLAGVPSIVFGVFGLGCFVYLAGGTLDRIFYPEALPTPTFGTGGILWASLTLAILTVPVVVVTAEEGLAAVPPSVREGSAALGATKFETTWRVVLPAAAPGILTGWILAISRAAGEVAPLMILGMVKLAPALPVDGYFPFVHLERKFMHLGFHIYDVGFQSPNVEATKPLVYATALLLVGIVTVMNLLAISMRNHLRRKYASSVF